MNQLINGLGVEATWINKCTDNYTQIDLTSFLKESKWHNDLLQLISVMIMVFKYHYYVLVALMAAFFIVVICFEGCFRKMIESMKRNDLMGEFKLMFAMYTIYN